MARGVLLFVPLILATLHSASCRPIAVGRDIVEVGFYGEALCPYCANFTSQIMKPLFDNKIMDLAYLTYIPYGNARYDSDKDTYTCQHGPRECELNTVLSCAIHLYTGQNNWFPFVECLERSAFSEKDTASLVKKCAAAGQYSVDDIMGCASGDLGQELQRAAMKQTRSLRPAHTYVPWVVVNGIPLKDDYAALAKFICVAYQGEKPDACFNIPGPSSLRQGLSKATHVSQT